MKYIAYGSNMVQEQMAFRCPDARLIGTGYIKERWPVHMSDGSQIEGMIYIMKMIRQSPPHSASTRASRTPTGSSACALKSAPS